MHLDCSWLSVALLGAVAACGEPAGEEVVWELQPAMISFYGDSSIHVPDTASVGAPLLVRVTSYGGGCVRGGITRTTTQGLVAIVEPLDSVVVRQPPNRDCTLELGEYVHSATVQFGVTGTAAVRILGRHNGSTQVFTSERAVQVR